MKGIQNISLKTKIILACVILFLSMAVFSIAMKITEDRAPYIQSGGFEKSYSGDARMIISNSEDAFIFVRGRENVENLTLYSMTYSQNCSGLEYGVYVDEKKIIYDICQNGLYVVMKQKPMENDFLKDITDMLWKYLEKKFGEWFHKYF